MPAQTEEDVDVIVIFGEELTVIVLEPSPVQPVEFVPVTVYVVVASGLKVMLAVV